MNYSRRSALTILSSGSLLSFLKDSEYSRQETYIPPSNSYEENIILGLSNAYNSDILYKDQLRTVQALGYIASQRILVDQNAITITQAANNVRQSLHREQVYDPKIYNDLTNLLKISSIEQDSLFSALSIILKGTSAGVGAAFSGPIAAGTLAIGSELIDKSFIYLNDSQKERFVTSLTDEEAFALTAWASEAYYNILRNSPNGQKIAIELYKLNDIKLNPQLKVTDAIKKLPKSIQNVYNAKSNLADLEKAIRIEIENGVKKMDERATELQRLLANEKNAQVRAAKEAEALKDLQYISLEINGFGRVGNFLLSAAGNPKLGQGFQTFIGSSVNIYLALVTPGLGPLAIAGALADAGSSIIGLFKQGDSLLAALQPINAKLDLVLHRLEYISFQQEQILISLKNIYQAILNNSAQLNIIKDQLNQIAKGANDNAVTLQRGNFESSVIKLGLMLNNTPDVNSSSSLRQAYLDKIADSIDYSTNKARSDIQSANFDTTRSEVEWLNEITSRGRVDRLFGFLYKLANDIGTILPNITEQPSYKPINPVAWAEGVNIFLEGRIRATSVPFQSEDVWLKQLWLDGQYARKMVIEMTQPEVVSLIGEKLKLAAGFPAKGANLDITTLLQSNSIAGEICRIAQDIDSRIIPRNINFGGGGKKYGIDLGRQNSMVNDYFQMLLDEGIISLEGHIQTPGANANYRNCRARIIKGPLQGSLLLPNEFTDGPERYYPVVNAAGNNMGFLFSCWELQRISLDVALGYIYRPRFIKHFSSEIQQKLLNMNYTPFEYWGAVMSVVGTLITWRANNKEQKENYLLSNIAGPFSKSEVSPFLFTYLDQISFNGKWPLDIVNSFGKCLDDRIESMRTTASFIRVDKSLPIIDETLRRLGTYMISRKVPLRAL